MKKHAYFHNLDVSQTLPRKPSQFSNRARITSAKSTIQIRSKMFIYDAPVILAFAILAFTLFLVISWLLLLFKHRLVTMEAKHVASLNSFSKLCFKLCFLTIFNTINAWKAIPGKTCGVAKSMDRIVGGSQVSSSTSYPWQARFTACFKGGVGQAQDTGQTFAWNQRCMCVGSKS